MLLFKLSIILLLFAFIALLGLAVYYDNKDIGVYFEYGYGSVGVLLFIVTFVYVYKISSKKISKK